MSYCSNGSSMISFPTNDSIISSTSSIIFTISLNVLSSSKPEIALWASCFAAILLRESPDTSTIAMISFISAALALFTLWWPLMISNFPSTKTKRGRLSNCPRFLMLAVSWSCISFFMNLALMSCSLTLSSGTLAITKPEPIS